jgi:ribonuclease HI
MKRITIVCDGSSLGNGMQVTRAGAVAVLTYVNGEGKTQHRVVGEYLGHATNNQAEIVAAAIGLEALKEPCQVELVSDSRYVIETRNGNYREKTNHDFWKRLRDAARPHRVSWTWTRGHSGHPVQELCDKAAKKIAALGWCDQSVLDETFAQVFDAARPSPR